MELTIIAAVAENGGIGLNGMIPWKIKKDMQRFKDLTLGHPVIMGRKTYDSLETRFKPLPKRKNIILSTTLGETPGIYIARDVRKALDLTEKQDSFVIGGAEIYKTFLHLSNRMEITRIHQNFNADAFFPEVIWKYWNLEKEIDGVSEENEGGIPYSFLTYTRRQ